MVKEEKELREDHGFLLLTDDEVAEKRESEKEEERENDREQQEAS
jgi:hypothetical protein